MKSTIIIKLRKSASCWFCFMIVWKEGGYVGCRSFGICCREGPTGRCLCLLWLIAPAAGSLRKCWRSNIPSWRCRTAGWCGWVVWAQLPSLRSWEVQPGHRGRIFHTLGIIAWILLTLINMFKFKYIPAHRTLLFWRNQLKTPKTRLEIFPALTWWLAKAYRNFKEHTWLIYRYSQVFIQDMLYSNRHCWTHPVS